MAILDGFVEKDMIEQIMTLDELSSHKPTDFLSELIDLFLNARVDQAVEEMLYHALFTALDGRPDIIIEGLQHSDARFVLICIRRACEDGALETIPPLKGVLAASEDDEIISEVLRSFSGFADPTLVKVVLPYIHHKNSAVVAWALHSIVALGGEDACGGLQSFIRDKALLAEKEGVCDLDTAQAVSAIAKLDDPSVANFLARYIHHPVPLFRKEVVNAFVAIGKNALPVLGEVLADGSLDEQIMAANILGWIKNRKGADILALFLDERGEITTNLRFAIFEALGRIPSIRSLTLLADGLQEVDELVLMAVVTGLNELCNPGIIKNIVSVVQEGDKQAERVLQTIIASHSLKIFRALYPLEEIAVAMVNLLRGRDKESRESFKRAIEEVGGERSAADIECLSAEETSLKTKRVVAVDDSKAMLFFYKNAASDMAIELITLPDGIDALQYFKHEEDGQAVDLLITDMNMPGMDGLELTRELRKIDRWANLPIIMATTETEQSQTKQAQEAGVNDFISKPFTKEVLQEKMRSTLT